MTERNTLKIKRADDVKPPRKTASDAQVRAENARLRADLATAQQRIVELEQRAADALSRIDWAIDSLHNLGGGE